MEAKRVEGLWDCSYCGQTGIKARFDTCTSCGKSRGAETIFYMPQDIESAVLTREEALKTSKEPDWLCEYCGSLNSSNRHSCDKCGADRSEARQNYGTLHKLTGKLFGKRK